MEATNIEVNGLVNIDQHFDPESENPQSGLATAEAMGSVKTCFKDGEAPGAAQQKDVVYNQVVGFFTPQMIAYLMSLGMPEAMATAQAPTQVQQTLQKDFGITAETDLTNIANAIGCIAMGVASKNYSIAGLTSGYNVEAGNEENPLSSIGASALGIGTKAKAKASFAGGIETEADADGALVYGIAQDCCYTDGATDSDKSILKDFMGWVIELKDILIAQGLKDEKVLSSFPTVNTDTVRFGKNLSPNSAVYGANIGLAGNGALTAGSFNYNNASSGIVGGSWNIITGYQHLVAGNFNRMLAYTLGGAIGNILAGACNNIKEVSMSTINGHINVVENADGVLVNGIRLVLQGLSKSQREIGKTVTGYYNDPKTNTLLEIGNGQFGARSNAFEVLKDGRAVVGKAPEGKMDVANKGYVDAFESRIVMLEAKIAELSSVK